MKLQAPAPTASEDGVLLETALDGLEPELESVSEPAIALSFPPSDAEAATSLQPLEDVSKEEGPTQLASLDDFASEGARQAYASAMAATQLASLDDELHAPEAAAEKPVETVAGEVPVESLSADDSAVGLLRRTSGRDSQSHW